MQSLWNLWIVIHCAHEFSLQWGDLILFVCCLSLYRIAQACGVLRNYAGNAGGEAMSGQNVLRRDVFDVRKFIFGRNLGRVAWLAEWLYEKEVNATAEGVAFALTGKRSS